MQNLLTKGRALAQFVTKSGPAMEKLKNACIMVGIPYTSLKNPNKTRWSSAYTNTSSIIKLKKALLYLASEDDAGSWEEKTFTVAEWKLAEGAAGPLELCLLVGMDGIYKLVF